jgi:hypothetical protein
MSSTESNIDEEKSKDEVIAELQTQVKELRRQVQISHYQVGTYFSSPLAVANLTGLRTVPEVRKLRLIAES